MKNEFVMVPRGLAETFDRSNSPPPAWAVEKLRGILDAPAEQHQGEPVAWRYRWSLEPHKPWIYQPTKPVDSRGYDIEALYTHADPGEVDRLRRERQRMDGALVAAANERDTLRAQLVEMTTKRDRLREGMDNANININNWFKDNQKLEAQLADRDSLLREVRQSCHPKHMAKIDAALERKS